MAKAAVGNIVTARAFGRVTVSLGLINVRVKLVTMVKDKGVHLHYVSRKDAQRVKTVKVDASGKVLTAEEMALAYDDGGNLIILEKGEIDSVKPPSNDQVKIEGFVDVGTIDPMFFNSTYILTPDESDEAYSLLAAVLQKVGKAAMGRITVRSKEHPALIWPYHGRLVLTTMHHADEVVDPLNLDTLREMAEPTKEMMDLAMNVLDDDTLEAEFDPSAYVDSYRARMEELVEAKKKGEKIVAAAPAPVSKKEDVMAALKAMAGKKKPKGKKA
jgi:DNA end-binding protein Ku